MPVEIVWQPDELLPRHPNGLKFEALDSAAVRAIDCAACALLSDGRHIVPFDEVVRTMWETGRDMKASYRETARGGLAKIHLQRKHGLDSFPGMGS